MNRSDLFQKVYQQILNESVEDNLQYKQITPYNTVRRFLYISHLEKRSGERYFNRLTITEIKGLINTFIEELNTQNIWINLPNKGKGFTVYAKWSNVWISGRLFYKNNQKKIYVSTVLPPPAPKSYPEDLKMDLDI